jgi:hypothetical protein
MKCVVPAGHETCPFCNGKGYVKQGIERREEESDEREHYCDTLPCRALIWGSDGPVCQQGLKITFRVPADYEDIQQGTWGVIRNKSCQKVVCK